MKWEYEVKDFVIKDAKNKLNALGAEGWEMIGFYDLSGGTYVRVGLRRQISSEPSLLGVN